MKTPADVVEALDELGAGGYADTFRAEACGLRAAALGGCCHAPEELRIERAYRFEADSQPDDQALVLGLRCRPHGRAGTFVVAYGPKTSALEAELLGRLPDERPFSPASR